MSKPVTAIQSYGRVDRTPKETYGKGPTVLRIGNGGAGATGLIRALAEDFLTTLPQDGCIEWICNHSRNTQIALLEGTVDIALTYERNQEALAHSEGWSQTIGCAFHDHFLLAGPVADGADIESSTTVEEALRRIAHSGALFHSRADASATMWKERSLWSQSTIEPWSGSANSPWYVTSHLSPAEALIAADEAGAYLLTDRSTLLRQVSLGTISNTTVYFEPTSADHQLMNSCYALIAATTSPVKLSSVPRSIFLEYLLSERGQKIVSEYGSVATGGFPLFAPFKDGFAKKCLRGGHPYNRHWAQ